ncbi:MAG: hypothetical protein KGY48_10340 [Wenzhouxiangellaceae bacterium]|nr:hypothetical protein [Wenzhouxiangellaceae bacterium]
MKRLTLLCIFWAAAGLVRADGVIEINQACVDIGCFEGDSAGFPIRIRQSGSYRLTSDIDTDAALTQAIEIQGDGVTLDLNGYTVRGRQSCQYDQNSSEVRCDLQEDLVNNMIRAFGTGHTIRNGSVRGALGTGISLGGAEPGGPHLVENVHLSENGSRSLRAEGDGPITQGAGIDVAPNKSALIRNCTSSLTARGFAGSEHTRFQGNLSDQTQAQGFDTGVCSDNTVSRSGGVAYTNCADLGGNSP